MANKIRLAEDSKVQVMSGPLKGVEGHAFHSSGRFYRVYEWIPGKINEPLLGWFTRSQLKRVPE